MKALPLHGLYPMLRFAHLPGVGDAVGAGVGDGEGAAQTRARTRRGRDIRS